MRKRSTISCIAAVTFLALCTTGFTEMRKRELMLDGAGIEHDAHLINLRFDRQNNTIVLDNTVLIEDDAPAKGVPEGYDENGLEWQESLKKGIVIKKILLVEDARAFSGRLVFNAVEMNGNTEPLHLSLNGTGFTRNASQFAAPLARQFTMGEWDRWYYVDLPVGALKNGENEMLMWTESTDVSWRVLIALDQEYKRGSIVRTSHPNRSMKSSDSGVTWSDTSLGTTDSVDGEYAVRISLDRYVPEGDYVSPIIDIISGDDPLKRKTAINSITWHADIDTPGETVAAAFIRFGESPLPGHPSWTGWVPFKIGEAITKFSGKRYLQWKVALSTANPLTTPCIRGFSAAAEWEDASPHTGAGLTVHAVRNGRVTRGSYHFAYEDLEHRGLTKLRKRFKLDKIVRGAATEFEVMARLLHWAYRIPVTSDRYSWNWNDVVRYEKGKRRMPGLHEDYPKRRRDAMCLYSNQALIGALLSFGFQARHVNIHSEALSGHEVTEVWSNDYNKWIHLDATRDYYYFDPDTGIPLNVLEVHDRLAEAVPRIETLHRPFWPEIGPEVVAHVRIGYREGDNPFSVAEDAVHIIGIMGYFRIIPRNDFLSNPLPVPVHTGATMWGWDGFLNHYDEKFPKRYEYQCQTDRPLDFYEPLNQAEVFLSETDNPGELLVEVDTFTPGGFDTFLVRINDGPWEVQKDNAWTWRIHGGIQTLEVRTRNIRGVLGPVSRLQVLYNP